MDLNFGDGTPLDLNFAFNASRSTGAAVQNFGLRATYRDFHTVGELRVACPTIALMKFAPSVDYCITVLDVGNMAVTVGDPLKGKRQLSLDEFYNQRRRSGVALQRKYEIQRKIMFDIGFKTG